MPFALWLLLGGVAAFLVFKSGQTATAPSASALSSGTGTMTLSVSGPAGTGPFSVPVEASLPLALQSEFTSFFANADQASFTDQTVLNFSNQLADLGFSVAAGSLQSVWEMVIAAMNAGVEGGTSSTSACPSGYQPAPHSLGVQMMEGNSHVQQCVPVSSSGSSNLSELQPVVKTAQGIVFQKVPVPTVNLEK